MSAKFPRGGGAGPFLARSLYVAGTQKNRLNETVLLSTQNTCLNKWVRKLLKFYANKIPLSGPMMLVLTICKRRTSNECRYDEWNSAKLQENNLS